MKYLLAVISCAAFCLTSDLPFSDARGGHEGGDHESMARETGCGGRPCPVGFINHPTWAGNTGPCWDYWIRGNAEGRNRTMLWDEFQAQCLARLNGQRLPVQRVAVHVHPKPVVQTAPALPRSAPLPKQTVAPRPVVVATVAPRDPIGDFLMHVFR